MTAEIEQRLCDLFQSWAGEPCVEHIAISANGSHRQYCRMRGSTCQCMAAYNEDVQENDTFLYYSRYFRDEGLSVPEIYAVGDDHTCYLQQDLGDTTLYTYLYDKKRGGGGFDQEMLVLYKQVLDDLVEFQIRGRGLDFSQAYPRSDFDRQSVQWDLNYFKYYFLKLAYIPFNEQLLEEDFDRFAQFLLEGDCGYFMYRDFQSRNIMLYQGKLYYIDYQGGRRGAAQYDVASLLYSAKSDLPEPIRQELLRHYMQRLAQRLGEEYQSLEHRYLNRFYGYVLVRIMQAMGAYGYRGYFERKDYFLKSIPLAVENLKHIAQEHPLPVALPHLAEVWKAIAENATLRALGATAETGGVLTVTVGSFSYKKGLPEDHSGNGGGYIFDCRALPNPGRYPQYRTFTGNDAPVIEFLRKEHAVDEFVGHALELVSASVDLYLSRQFTSLTVYFGCTGGQHRSVYCAERLAEQLEQRYPQIRVHRHHREWE